MLVTDWRTEYLYLNEYYQVGRLRIANFEFWTTYRADKYAKFLSQFTRDRITVIFACFTLSAGEFPETSVTFIKRALANEVTIFSLNNSRDDSRDGISHTQLRRR
jgi:hypothetical protein